MSCCSTVTPIVSWTGQSKKTVVFADAHPEAAVVGCRVLNPDRTLQSTCFMFPSALNLLLSFTYLYKIFPKEPILGSREFLTYWDRDDVRPVDVVSGCFMLVRREAIEQVGRMDEAFFMYAEETDWCYRFRQGGLGRALHPRRPHHPSGRSEQPASGLENDDCRCGAAFCTF
jgi:GT2 family glycosyltransferase